MMKKAASIFIIAFLALSSVSVAQDRTSATKKATEENIYTSLKPADGQPAVFSSQQEKDAKVQGKKDAVVLMIRENANNPEKVKYLREELWRFENAIVAEPK